MTKIKISGVIIPNDYQDVYDWIGWDATSPKKVEQALADIEDDKVTVEINSGGGSVFAGSEIYTLLKSSEKHITVNIVGVAASAASIIAMAGDVVRMSPTAQMMIHNATIVAEGDYRDMESATRLLKNANQTAVNAYRMKSGMSEEELFDLMDRETWFTPQQALQVKLIDEIMFEEELLISANIDSGLLPMEVVNKIKTKLINKEKSTNEQSDFLFAKLQLLKLKGDVKI